MAVLTVCCGILSLAMLPHDEPVELSIDLTTGTHVEDLKSLLSVAPINSDAPPANLKVAQSCRFSFRPNVHSQLTFDNCSVVVAFHDRQLITVMVGQSCESPDDAADFVSLIAGALDDDHKLKADLTKWLDGDEMGQLRCIYKLKASQSVDVVMRKGVPTHLDLTFEVGTHFPQTDPTPVVRQLSALEEPADESVSVRRIQHCETEFIQISPRQFTMGNQSSVVRRDDEKPVEVEITKPFAIQRTEVTQKEWFSVMGFRPWIAQKNVIYGDDYAAVYMSWPEMNDYCRKLTIILRELGEITESEVVRLPTEAEWELACRGGSQSMFCFGDDLTEFKEYAWVRDREVPPGPGVPKNAFPHRVAQKKPNRFGLFDMHGNVSEFCADYYDVVLQGGRDPQGPSTAEGRVVKGGSWNAPRPLDNRCAERWMNFENRRYSSVGFRPVISVDSRPGTSRAN
jgi:sulfatase modifying factor 1